MPTHDYDIANQSGAAFRTDLNNALAAIQSNNSNSSSPSTTIAYQWWADTTANIFKIRNSSNNAWINLFTLAGGIDVDATSNFNADVTFTGGTSGRDIVFDQSDNALEFADNAKATFGNGADLAIYHEGNHSYIQDQGTGSLILVGNTVAMQNAAQSENMFVAIENSTVSLYFDNAVKLATAADRVNVTGHLFVNGGNSLYIQNGFTNSNARIRNTGGSNDSNLEFLIRESGTELEALEITNTGHIRIPNDDKRLKIGAGDDIQIYHDGSESYVKNTNSNSNLILEGAHGVNIKHGGEKMADFNPDAAVKLYFDNDLKFELQSGGTKTTGTHTVTTNIFTNDIRSITCTNDDSTSHVSVSARNAACGHGEYFIVGVSGNIYFGAAATQYSSNPAGTNQNGATTIRVFGGISSNASGDSHRLGRNADGSILLFQSEGSTEGSVAISGSTTSYNTSSDYRLKENIIDLADGITRIKQLKPKRFNFIKDPSITKDGFLAHEVSPIVPEAVQGTKDETYTKDEDENLIKAGDPKYQQMDAGKLIPLLTAAVQEAIAKIETLETKVAALEAA